MKKIQRPLHYLIPLWVSAMTVAGLSISQAPAQNLDSLYSVWKDPGKTDSVRIKAYSSFIWKGFLFSQPNTAFLMADTLLAFSKEHDFPWGVSNAYYTQGVTYQIQGDYPNALTYCQRSLEVNEEMENAKGIAALAGNIGLIYHYQGNNPKALEYFQRSLKIYDAEGNKAGISGVLNNIGLVYADQGDLSMALDYYERSLAIKEEIEDQQGISYNLHNIALILYKQGNYAEALDYNQRSLKLKEALDDKGGIASSLLSMGQVYQKQHDLEKALDHYQKSTKVYESVGDKGGIAYNLANIGEINLKQGNFPQALKNCKESLSLAEEAGVRVQQRGACQCLYDTYKAMNQGSQALVYLEKLNAIKDSMNQSETAKKLQQMEFQKKALADSLNREEEKLKIEMAHQEEVWKNKMSQNIFLGAGLLFLLLAGGFYSRWQYVKKSKAIIEQEKDRSDQLLLNILPEEIAEELKQDGKSEARDYDMATILFSDFVTFTEISEMLSAAELVEEVNACFEAFDHIVEKYQIEKIKTIGDAYMAVGGLPIPSDDSVKNTVFAALEMQQFISNRKQMKEGLGGLAFEMRVGIHTGPVVAGIVGVKKFQYDIWGDAVNTASRLESSGESGKVNISQSTYELLKEDPVFVFESRGRIEVKGKGAIEMWYVENAS